MEKFTRRPRRGQNKRCTTSRDWDSCSMWGHKKKKVIIYNRKKRVQRWAGTTILWEFHIPRPDCIRKCMEMCTVTNRQRHWMKTTTFCCSTFHSAVFTHPGDYPYTISDVVTRRVNHQKLSAPQYDFYLTLSRFLRFWVWREQLNGNSVGRLCPYTHTYTDTHLKRSLCVKADSKTKKFKMDIRPFNSIDTRSTVFHVYLF